MKTFLVALFFPLAAIAGNDSLTGNARMDLLAVSTLDSLPQTKSVMVHNTVDRSRLKSPLLGGTLSFLVPGAGNIIPTATSRAVSSSRRKSQRSPRRLSTATRGIALPPHFRITRTSTGALSITRFG